MKSSNSVISQSERENIISAQPVFSLLTPEDVSELANLMDETLIPKDTLIVKEGDLVDSVYLLAKGMAEVSRQSVVDGAPKKIIIATLHSGEAIGLSESGFFSKTGIRTATVTAIEDLTLLKISIEKLHDFFQDPNRLYHGLQQSSERMLKMNLVKRADPFAELTSDEISKLVDRIEEIYIPENQYIYQQGETGEACYLIREGIVDIVAESKRGNKIVATLYPISVFGMGALLTFNERVTSALTATPCRLLILRRSLLDEILRRDIFAEKGKETKEVSPTPPALPKPIPETLVIQDKSSHGGFIYNWFRKISHWLGK